ncbi:helix-turn-helix transcriptional regulator [Streptomyces gardneri]|uniref:Helix-turn-helix transcriptional regulator n=1 Tax=Streptomyces gardneri TaxID=66892 RepID=A0A4Y3RFN9_9ACTN|nr:helix-turn-helix transcriptional regulator [Streptomyces gardneri]GEB55708.1 helix-turn-helix transcriptional regulator [Streptomyces gardneri]GHH19078.1 helix-turn-helix transcriptional regulator [Streptomyces gardneri]
MSGATHTAADPRLYDRTAELAAVGRLSARTAAGRGGVLFVTGNPGEGRTSLLSRAASDFPGTAYRVAAPHHRGPWSAARVLFATLAPTPAAARRALRLARGEGGLARAMATLVTEAEPVLICVDDLHLWDAHSRAALAAAWQETDGRGPGRPGRVGWLVSAARHHRFPEVPGAETVRLGRLTTAGARALLADLCTVAAPAPPVAERLLDEAAGHPGVLAATVRRLTVAQLAGTQPLPQPAVDDTVLAEVYGGLLERLPAASRRLLATVAVAVLAGRTGADCARAETYGVRDGGSGVDGRAPSARASAEPLEGLVADGLLRRRRGGAVGFDDPFLGRAALASARPSWRGETRAPGPAKGATPSADLPADRPAAGAAALARGRGHRADRLGPSAAVRALSPVARGRAHLVRGLAALAGGPVMDAHEELLQAAELLRGRAPVEASDARFLAMEAAWAGGDVEGCLAALDGGEDVRGTERDFAEGLSAALTVRLDDARTALTRVVTGDGATDDPRLLLRAGSAALVLGDTATAARVHARALVKARAEHRTALLPRALEQLAYAELRAGRYSRAARTAREGLRTAEATGQHNVAAHQHAVLALVASVEGDGTAVTEHAGRALATAGPHGLVQAATLAEWALARAELGRGLAAQAAARLVPLVRPGPRGGHFALRMLVVPCFVEAAVATGRDAEAREAAEEYAAWAALGVDGPAPAQLARCRALLGEGEAPAYWFGEAVRRHDSCGNDFERARTLLAYGTWLRRRRRPGDARGPLRDALVTFERAAAGGWAEHTRSELRATGGASGGATDPAAPRELTPQQQRIVRLVARGATNQEVADHLSLSPRTVDHHLRGVFARLGIRSRVELPGVVDGWDADGEARTVATERPECR